MSTRYRQGYMLEKMIVDRLNKSCEWLCQRGPSSKGIDVLACSKKHYKTVFLECKNTDQLTFSIAREQVTDLVRKGFIGGAEVYVAIHWRKLRHDTDKRKKKLCLYPVEFLSKKFDGNEQKTVTFKPNDYHLSFEEVFSV
ncbi:hypothetical protein ACFLQ2_02130 [archaeon]